MSPETANAAEQNELILWGQPKGSNDPINERVLYTHAFTSEQIEKVKAIAAKDGWHSFRVQTLNFDGALDFGKMVTL